MHDLADWYRAHAPVTADSILPARDAAALERAQRRAGEATGTWDQLEVLMSRWRSIEALLAEPGPFIHVATRTRLRPIDSS